MREILEPEGFVAEYLEPNADSIESRKGLEWIGIWKLSKMDKQKEKSRYDTDDSIWGGYLDRFE